MAVASKQGNQLTHRWLFFRILMKTLIWTPPLQMHSNGTSDPLDTYIWLYMYAYVTSGFVLATIACGSLKEPSKDERNGYFMVLLKSENPSTFFRSSMIHSSKLAVPCWWTRLRDAFVVNQSNLAAWTQRLQPLSLSAKIFLHHRQRLRFAFASQIRSITRRSSTNQFKHTWDQSKTTESTAEHQLVDPSIFTLASDSGCFLVLSSCVICVAVYDKHNPKAHKAMETHKHYGPTNKISAYAYESQCHFVSTQCVLHKERKQELCNLFCRRLHNGNTE